MASLAKAERDKLARKHKRRLAAIRKDFTVRLAAVLDNADGLDRLRAISDEEWQAAVDADDGRSGGEGAP